MRNERGIHVREGEGKAEKGGWEEGERNGGVRGERMAG